MSFFRKVSPTGAARDFAAVWTANPYRWPVLAAAMGGTLGMLVIFIPKSEIVPPAKPEITYITTFPDGRTDDQIIASNIKNQEKQDELRARQAEQDEVRKGLYRDLGKVTGIDTDTIERDIKKDEAAQKAAEEKALAKTRAEREAAAHSVDKH